MKRKKILRGKVVSNSSSKTIVVQVQRRFKHPIYSKFVTKTKKYHAHDENETANLDDVVYIQESRQFSKLKKWKLVEIK